MRFKTTEIERNAKATTRVAKAQRVVACCGLASFAVLSTIAGISYALGDQPGFSVQIDSASRGRQEVYLHPHRALQSDDSAAATRLYAGGLAGARPTTAEAVWAHFRTINEEEDLSGTHVFSAHPGANHGVFYTFYLSNHSEYEKTLLFTIQLDSYLPPRNVGVNHPYSYLRFVIFYGSEDGGSYRVITYGAANEHGLGTISGGQFDDRECISRYQILAVDEGIQARQTLFLGDGDGYCENFREDGESIVLHDFALLPHEVLRFTIVMYLEGNDPDCTKSAPEGCRMAASAHFWEAL